jgi:prephenate dehydrogenase
MSNFTITIVGAGVIGTSLGLALKQEQDPPCLLVHDKELANANAAVKKGAFDKAEWNLINACEKADLIILAIPLNGVQPTLAVIAPYLKKNTVISDTSRSKLPVLAWADELLPDHVHYVGGDPVVHPPGSGYEHASADLFRDRLYCLTPAPSTEEAAVQLLVGVLNIIGAQPFFLDAAEHDGLVTAAEHLPTVLSAALLHTLSAQGSWRELRKLAGRLFEQVSSGVAGDADALKDNLLTNRNNLIHWLDNYITQLSQLRTLLTEADDSEEALIEMLDQAVVERYNWLVDYQKGRFVDPQLEPVKVETPGFMKRMIGLGR